jgi:2-dehydro-3-deoxygalactonokinase
VDIFIDWGSTNFHAFLVHEGEVVDRHEVAGQGILTPFGAAAATSRDAAYSSFLAKSIAPWLERCPQAPILMCGAIGSREGWVQARYVEAPAGFGEMAAGLYRFSATERGELRGRAVAVTSGLAIVHPDGRHDVMRSEEVKGLGAATILGLDDALICLPGTHCKWIRAEGGRIVDLNTIMTGDLYGVLCEHGSLAPLFLGPVATGGGEECFELGLELASRGADLLADLWQVRARPLHAATPPTDLRAFLSGILIGHEVRQALSLDPTARRVVLVSDPGPRRLFYRRACEKFGLAIGAEVDSQTAVCAGLTMIRNHPAAARALVAA